MKRLTTIKPYSDSKLEWNEETKQYTLALNYCKELFDDNFRDDTVYAKRIKKNSRKIYNFISSHIFSRNRRVVEFLLQNTQEGRDFLLKILTEQMEADVESGYNDLSSNPGINVTSGQIIDRREFQKNQISVDAEQTFDSSDEFFGFRIGYQAQFPPIYFTLLR